MENKIEENSSIHSRERIEKIKWEFKKNIESQGSSDGFWYDITYGGYIRPEELLENEHQLKQLNDALEVIRSFEEALEENELLNEF